MAQDATAVQEKSKSKPKQVKVTVRFAMTTQKPYAEEFDSSTTIGKVREKAMACFGVHDEPNIAYYLTDDHNDQLDNNVTIGDFAPGEKHVKFKLIKRTASGSK